jgi:hypothetical protein
MHKRAVDIHLTALYLDIRREIFTAHLILFQNIANNNHFVQCFCGEKWRADQQQGGPQQPRGRG